MQRIILVKPPCHKDKDSIMGGRAYPLDLVLLHALPLLLPRPPDMLPTNQAVLPKRSALVQVRQHHRVPRQLDGPLLDDVHRVRAFALAEDHIRLQRLRSNNKRR